MQHKPLKDTLKLPKTNMYAYTLTRLDASETPERPKKIDLNGHR